MADVGVCTATGFTKRVGALTYRVDPENEECKIAYLNLLFERPQHHRRSRHHVLRANPGHR